ncbi:MAG: 16S rRNA (cytosine(1402)-N(4))-methyltransferase RsmH [bacterium]
MPVLLKEAVEKLKVTPGGTYVDCTVGTGGHAESILEESSPDGSLLAIDRDTKAIEIAERRLERFRGRVRFFRRRFGELEGILREAHIGAVDGFLFDLGVSAIQIEDRSRGFSYRLDGPLDMRMDQDDEFTAADLLNKLEAEELERIIRAYGEERWSRRVARSVVRERMKGGVESTGQLASIVRRSVGGKLAHKSLARVFQALRIRVNDELQELETGLASASENLKKGGRIVVISYHSLEDRIVKRKFLELSEGSGRTLRLITKKVVKPSQAEIKANKRARSARLRAAEAV